MSRPDNIAKKGINDAFVAFGHERLLAMLSPAPPLAVEKLA
jgi:hypothetical protein